MKTAFSDGRCVLLLACASLFAGQAQSEQAVADPIAAAVADPTRPESDRNRDAARKPAESLRFSGVRPGDVVADFNANSGYFTRLFADVVGTGGHVYAIEPIEIQQSIAKETAELQTYAAGHPNVTVSVATALDSLRTPKKLDLFWISQNYHDLHNSYFGPLEITAFNKAVFNALKPGGSFIVLDHSAAPGAPSDVTQTLHRIDAAVVRREVEAVGFVFEGESPILTNPADPRTVAVFDQSIRGHTDQFILRFRKPPSSTRAPAAHDGQHDFDFNIGVWHTHIRRALDPFSSSSEFIELDGTVTVRKVWDGKAELEEIEADGPKGHWEGLTLFLYNPLAHQWSQTFANSKVGTLSSNFGDFRDGRVVLVGQDTVNDATILVRAVWSNITSESHQYEESYSNDAGTTWVRAFTAQLTRLKQ